jgi:glycosyl-4,4'-diaponeurosporenoate acyltransferase
VGVAVTPLPAVAVDAAVWASWGTAIGWAAARAPDARFAADGPITRIRRWERHGRTWERVGVRRWKDAVPELGALFGGTTKRRLPGRGRAGLEQLAVETRRAELVHWWAPLPIVVMPLWNPAWLMVAMVGYAVVANGPCIVIQRYNRARISRLLGRPAAARRGSAA